jgi:hypothetical protein
MRRILLVVTAVLLVLVLSFALTGCRKSSGKGVAGTCRPQGAPCRLQSPKDCGQVTVGGEERIDLGRGCARSRHSRCRGCRSSFVLSQVRGNLRPLHVCTRDDTPPQQEPVEARKHALTGASCWS